MTWPPSSRITRGHSRSTDGMLCETKSTVRPVPLELLHPAQALLLELRVADREHLVHEQDLRLEVRRHRERQPHVHAARVALHGGVQELCESPENSTISSNLASTSDLRMPMMAAESMMFSRPVSSGWKPVPTSSSEPTRPIDLAPARGRRGDPREDLQHRALAGPVAPDDADRLAGPDLERDVLQRPEVPFGLLGLAAAPGREPGDVLAERAVPADALGGAEAVALADALGADRDLR